MNSMRDQLNNPWVIGLGSFAIGLFIGLVVLGWWLWPVQWSDAAPSDLRIEYQEIYLRMAIDSYTRNPNEEFAQQRINEIGPGADELLAQIAQNPGNQDPQAIQDFQRIAGGEVPEGTPSSEEPAAESPSLLRTLLPYMCLITFLLAGGLVAAFLLRNRIGSGAPRSSGARPEVVEAQPPAYAVAGEAPALAQFMTTYQLGNDLYDDSFSIDSQSGEFLGECGVGISETVGVGDPKKVSAFEVWLFDKNDIQTVTKVLMSRHTFSDDATRQKLEAKGEPIFAEPGREMMLETATLKLTARVVDMSYGAGALPDESFFDRMTLELIVWAKS